MHWIHVLNYLLLSDRLRLGVASLGTVLAERRGLAVLGSHGSEDTSDDDTATSEHHGGVGGLLGNKSSTGHECIKSYCSSKDERDFDWGIQFSGLLHISADLKPSHILRTHIAIGFR